MEQAQCAKYDNCEKMMLILSMDDEKYDVDGLTGDVCWLCEEYASEAIPAGIGPDKTCLSIN
ncbi:hypothetical protein ACFLV2_00365 [Chloroflexota bacterium]